MASILKQKDRNGNTVYRVSVSNGRGRRISRTFRPLQTWSAKTTKRELQKFASELELKLGEGKIMTKSEKEKAAKEHPPQTLEEYGNGIFLPEKAVSLSERSRLSYKQLLRDHVYPAFGSEKMCDIAPASIKVFLSKLRDEMSYASVIKVYAVMNTLFKSAVMDDTIEKNPMDKVQRPKRSKDEEVQTEPKSYTPEETRHILECLQNEPLRWQVYVKLLIDTGCRRGEISGLQWQAVDFDNSTITIDKNLQYSAEKGTYITTPKNRHSRIVDVSPEVMFFLEGLKIEQQPSSEWVFTRRNSTLPIHPDTPNRFFQRFSKKYHIESFHPHKLRHTSASIAITNGADVVSVAARLGHADSSTTLRMYAHANQDNIRKAGQVVRDAIYESDSEPTKD